jgi:predicted nicotinamide N-methyase
MIQGHDTNMTHDAIDRITVRACGRDWSLCRAGDLEELWQAMDDTAPGAEDRIPYWAELWPAGIMLADWLGGQAARIAGRRCLDVGCGLGLTAMAGAAAGARVVAMDLMPEPLAHARDNARENGVPGILFTRLDWRNPAFRPQSFEFIWGGDIVYEKRFFDPLERLFSHALSPGGRIWLGLARRDVSGAVWEFLGQRGWRAERLAIREVVHQGRPAQVALWEITRPADTSDAAPPEDDCAAGQRS